MTKETKLNAPDILKEYKPLVWQVIKGYLKSPDYPKLFKVRTKYKPMEKFHWVLVDDYPLRNSKYTRPTLVMLTAEALGAQRKDVVKTAAAMQLSEEWILVDDDIQDGSIMRRGKPTLQRIYGVELAINAGITLQTIMWKVLIDNYFVLDKNLAKKIFDEFYIMMMRTELGQTVEIKWFKENKLDFSIDDWYFIADSKSSYYSIAGPIRLGAILGGATPKQLEVLTEFGYQLGRCWQLVDDILDVTSDFGGLKEKGGDIYEGKRTVMLAHLLKVLHGKEKKELIRILEKRREKKTAEEVDWVIGKMETKGSIDYAKKIAMEHRDKALSVFKSKTGFLKVEPQRTKLEILANFILERKY